MDKPTSQFDAEVHAAEIRERGFTVIRDFMDAGALAEVAPYIDALGGAEDLAAHVNAVRARSGDVSDS